MVYKLSDKATCAFAQLAYMWMDDCPKDGQVLSALLECVADIEGDHRETPFQEGVPIEILSFVMSNPDAKKEISKLVYEYYDKLTTTKE